VLAIVPTRDSPAKQEGNDLLFATCSQACGQALKEALQKQIDFVPHTGYDVPHTGYDVPYTGYFAAT
jgi:hypothetical protein